MRHADPMRSAHDTTPRQSIEQLVRNLGYVTQTLATVVAGLANTTAVLPGDIGGSILMPVVDIAARRDCLAECLG